MKLLLDSCVWGGARAVLADEGHDVTWGGDLPEDPGDLELLRRAHAEQRVRVLALHSEDLTRGAIITVEPGRIRVRMPFPT